MKKDIEWLKKEIDTEMIELESHRAERWSDVKYQTLRSVAQKIYQLNEPEITLDKAFDKVAESYTMTKEDICRHLEQIDAHGGKVTYGESEVLSKEWIGEHKIHTHDYNGIVINAVPVYRLQNLITPKQELPVIPKYVGEFIEEAKASGDRLDDVFLNLRDIYYQGKTADWIAKENRNSETFARAWLDGYEVEEVPLYRVSATGIRSGFWFLCKDSNDDIAIGTNKDYFEADWDSLKLTEQEIKDYDPRYWPFAVEVENNDE